MTADRIKEIQDKTAFPDSVSVCQALFQVWNECQQDMAKDDEYLEKKMQIYKDDCKQVTGFDTLSEYNAYEKGREDEQSVIVEWIKNWDGSTNSVMGELLNNKLKTQ